MRQAGGFRQAAERERRHIVTHETRSPPLERIVEKHLVRNDRQLKLRKRVLLGRRHERAGRVVGIHRDDGARAIADCITDAFNVDFPSLMKLERERPHSDHLERAQMFEQRVRRDRGDDLVARIAQQLEEERIGLARRRCQNYVAAEGLARRGKSERVRCVGSARGAGENFRQLIERVVDSRSRRIRFGEIEELADAALPCKGEAIGGRVPVCAAGKELSTDN